MNPISLTIIPFGQKINSVYVLFVIPYWTAEVCVSCRTVDMDMIKLKWNGCM